MSSFCSGGDRVSHVMSCAQRAWLELGDARTRRIEKHATDRETVSSAVRVVSNRFRSLCAHVMYQLRCARQSRPTHAACMNCHILHSILSSVYPMSVYCATNELN